MNNGKVCVSVCAETADEVIAGIMRAEEFADMVEVRFDGLDPAQVAKAVDRLPEIRASYLFTFRPKEQGGKRELSLAERLKFWEIIFSRPRPKFMIDLEANPALLLAVDPSSTERIVSMHDFNGVPDDPGTYFDTMAGFGKHIKIAAAARDIVDTIPIWKLIERAKALGREVIPIAMGEAGKYTRVLGLAHGAFLTYVSLDDSSATADGQITARDLIEVYRAKELDRDTRVFGVIGDPVAQSLSPYFQNPALKAEALNAVFLPLLVTDLDAFFNRMVKTGTREVDLNFGGFSVTMPHKQAIMKHLDAIDATAEKIGAVNTVKISDGKLTGYNTDAHGFITPLKAKFGDLEDARVAIFGSGGAARACVFALKNEGADVRVFAREPARAAAIAKDFGVQIDQFRPAEGNLPTDCDIVVNATPMGMKGPLEGQSFFSADQLLGVRFVYDLVTKLTDTPLVVAAKEAGVPAIGGVEMLIAQGAEQFEIWTGREAPIELMRASLLARMTG